MFPPLSFLSLLLLRNGQNPVLLNVFQALGRLFQGHAVLFVRPSPALKNVYSLAHLNLLINKKSFYKDVKIFIKLTFCAHLSSCINTLCEELDLILTLVRQ